MKVYHLPVRIRGFIFDIDGTLYTNAEYVESQNTLLIQRLAEKRGLSYEEMYEEIEASRSAWAQTHGGEKLSLGNAMKAFGVTIAENIRWRNELFQPEKYLREDPVLRLTLGQLREFASLGVLTNNPTEIARRTLKALGVSDLFTGIVSLDTFEKSKPYEPSFRRAAQELGAPIPECVAVGDRYDIDIAIPLQLGMGGILVDGAEDVYKMTTIVGRS